MVDTNAKVLISVSTLSLKVTSGDSMSCRKNLVFFYVWLTVHPNRMVVYFYYQLDAQFF